MKNTELIPKSQYQHLPYLYKHIKVIDKNIWPQQKQSKGLMGKISAIQNDNAELITFYKCISRF